jgi:hypothetical protein
MGQSVFILHWPCSWLYSLSGGTSHGRHASPEQSQILAPGARPFFVAMGGRHVSLQFATHKLGLSLRVIFGPYRGLLQLQLGPFRVHISPRIVEIMASIPLVDMWEFFISRSDW